MVRCAYCGDPITRSDQGCRDSSRLGKKCTADKDPLPLPDVHSNCCWCGRGFLGRSGELKGCPVAPSGKHEHVAGHTHRHNEAADALGEPRLNHTELHPEKKPITLCVWCASGYTEGETCDERPGNPAGTLGHQTRQMAERAMAREAKQAKRHVAWLAIRKALDENDPGEALILFGQALDQAWFGGRKEAQRLRDEAAKRKEKQS